MTLHPYTTVAYFSQRPWTATTFSVDRAMFITGDLAFLLISGNHLAYVISALVNHLDFRFSFNLAHITFQSQAIVACGTGSFMD